MFERASKVLAGGVGASNQFVRPYPICIKNAKGKYLIDIDGNEYLDFHMGAGPKILGHAHPVVVEAIKKALGEGLEYQLVNEYEVELAERIVKAVPAVELLRFCNSGTEAVMIAMRVARGYTKKDKIGVIEGHYNGQEDYALVSGAVGNVLDWMGPEDEPAKTLDCAGIPQAVKNTIEVLPYNNIPVAEAWIKGYAKDLAAVIVEPMLAMGGTIPADKEYLKALREITEDKGILLIFDEVVTGFRTRLGGAQEYFGVKPDLTTFGKIIGGGLPVGAYGGRRDVMEVLISTPDKKVTVTEKVFGSGTFSGNPIIAAAGLAVIKELEKGKVHPHINRLGEKIRSGAADISSRLKIPFQATGLGSTFQFHTSDKPLKNRRDVMKAHSPKIVELYQRLFGRGIAMHPTHFANVCSLHTDEDIEKLLSTTEDILKKIK